MSRVSGAQRCPQTKTGHRKCRKSTTKRPRRSLRPPPALPLVDRAQIKHGVCGTSWRPPWGRPLATVSGVSGARLGVLRSACAKFGSEGSRKVKSRLWPRAGLFGAVVVRLCHCVTVGTLVAGYGGSGGDISCVVEAAQGGAKNLCESYSRSDSVCVAHTATELDDAVPPLRHQGTQSCTAI